MGRGIRYEHVEAILKKYYCGGIVLEIAAGGCVYRDIFEEYIGSDLPCSPYYQKNDLSLFCDGQFIPIKDNKIDFVFIVAALYQIPDVERVFSEVQRVLKDGGYFIIFDYNKPLLEKLEKLEGVTANHIWSPWELKSRLIRYKFKTEILNRWDYSTPRMRNFFLIFYKIPGFSNIVYRFFKEWSIICSKK